MTAYVRVNNMNQEVHCTRYMLARSWKLKSEVLLSSVRPLCASRSTLLYRLLEAVAHPRGSFRTCADLMHFTIKRKSKVQLYANFVVAHARYTNVLLRPAPSQQAHIKTHIEVGQASLHHRHILPSTPISPLRSPLARIDNFISLQRFCLGFPARALILGHIFHRENDHTTAGSCSRRQQNDPKPHHRYTKLKRHMCEKSRIDGFGVMIATEQGLASTLTFFEVDPLLTLYTIYTIG